MNRTSLSVIALAVGAVLTIGLYNVYKPAVNNTAHDVFDKVRIGRMEAGNEATNHRNPANDPNSPSNPQNIPDKYGVTPRQWKQGVKFQVLTPVTVGNGKSDIPVNHTVAHAFGHYWSYAGTPQQPEYKTFDQYHIAENTDNPIFTGSKFVPQSQFNAKEYGKWGSGTGHTFTTTYDKAKNLVNIYISSTWIPN